MNIHEKRKIAIGNLGKDKFISIVRHHRIQKTLISCIKPKEFLWGTYFRQHLTFEDTEEGFRQAVNKALLLCQSPQASKLLGYLYG